MAKTLQQKNKAYFEIRDKIKAGKLSPVYFLSGEEPYYIDQLSNLLASTIIPEDEKDFNQHILYGLETDMKHLIALSRSFPMVGKRQVVIVKQANDLKAFDGGERQAEQTEALTKYLDNPTSTTVLVFCYKKKLDARTKLSEKIKQKTAFMQSERLEEKDIPDLITKYFNSQKLQIADKTAEMLADSLGADLSKVLHEMDKLIIGMPEGTREITADLIEKFIGISKDYNDFQLKNALINRDMTKAYKVADYYINKTKTYNINKDIGLLFSYFATLMLCYWSKDKSELGIKAYLGQAYYVTDYLKGMKNYSSFKCMEIISLLRLYDAKSKGVENASATHGDLLKELLFKIIH